MSLAFSSKSVATSDRPSFAAWPLILFIYLYRITLGPILQAWFGVNCRFYPSCSHYAEDALRKYGAWRGSIMAAKRLFRCHPWHEGGFDPVK